MQTRPASPPTTARPTRTDPQANQQQTSSAPSGNGQDRKPGEESSLPAHIAASIPAIGDRQLVGWMFQFLRPVKGIVVITCLYLVAAIAFQVLFTDKIGTATNRISELHAEGAFGSIGFWSWITSAEQQAVQIRTNVLLLVALAVGGALLQYLYSVSQMKMSMEQVFHLREAVYDKLQRVGFGFHDAVSTGALINRSLGDLQNVRQFNQTATLTTLDILLTLGGYMILLLVRDPWVALIALIPTPIWTIYILRFNKNVQPVARASMEAGDRNVQVITENIAGVHVVKAFGTEKSEVAKYNDNTHDFFAKVRRRISMWANFHPVVNGIAQGAQVTLTLAVAIMVIKGRMQIGDFLVLGAAMGNILGKLQQVAAINEQYQNAIVSARRLYEILAAPATVDEKPDARALPPGSGAVTFDKVTFGYDPEKPVVRDITFNAKGGSVVAIVGPTGSGKSTLMNLIARFYDPQQGRITIDGADLRDVRLDSLRTQVSFVFQETYLFSDTVANNISYGRPGITRGEIEAAARLAQAHEFIEQLPKGYDSILAERGSSLSGGQRQRLAIARAILQNPRILVLDDATAAVDPETEDLIRRGMKFVMYGRTTFIIAHRLSTVRTADLVLVLGHGTIEQMGTHNELMDQPGHYREIAMVQLSSGDEEESPSHMKRVQKPGVVDAAKREGDKELSPDDSMV